MAACHGMVGPHDWIGGALHLRVVDDLSDLHKIDPRADAVEAGDSFTQLFREERVGRFSGLPDVEIRGAALGLVEGEELESQAGHSLEHGPSFVGHVHDPIAIKVPIEVKLHVYSDHSRSLRFRAQPFRAPTSGRPRLLFRGRVYQLSITLA